MNEKDISVIDFINKLLIAFCCDILNWTPDRVLIETRTRPRPIEKQYITIYWKDLDILVQTAGGGRFVDNDQYIEELDNESYCTVELSVRGDNAYNLAVKIRQAIESNQRWFDLWQVIGFAGCDTVHDLSAEYGAKIQQRAVFDLHFYVLLNTTYPADYFEKAPIDINDSETYMPLPIPDCLKGGKHG